jgi:SAM-dependent methyltransferase
MKDVRKPVHQNPDFKDSPLSKEFEFLPSEDLGGWFPSAESVRGYHGVSLNNYHDDRVRALKPIVRTIIEKNTSHLDILDFGSGDAKETLSLGFSLNSITCVDTSPHMLKQAKKNVNKLVPFFWGGGKYLVGGVEKLKNLGDSSIDLVLALNVLGYLSEEEEALFFEETVRILRPNGFLVVMTGNELFDLFALNSGTVDFFLQNFGNFDVSKLITEHERPRFKNARRHNPLKQEAILEEYGLRFKRITFSQYHKFPPVLLELDSKLSIREARLGARDFSLDPNSLPSSQHWANFFKCSIFAALYQKQ